MKQQVIGALMGLALATTLVAAQTNPQQPPTQQPPTQQPPAQQPPVPQQPAKGADVTMTGCLVQGSGPNVFILDNARGDATDRMEKGQTFLLASATEDLDFIHNLNREVSVVGQSDQKTAPVPPPGQKVDEKDLPKLSAKSVTAIADACTAAGR